GVNDWYFKKLSLPQTPITDFARSFYSQTHMVEQNTMTDTFPNFNWKQRSPVNVVYLPFRLKTRSAISRLRPLRLRCSIT
ncbi:MAG: hypothetical protein QF516_10465, partial [Pirellulaceae bacterium]|nr:hypothetical protein [Pirellulaceae bacterium]